MALLHFWVAKIVEVRSGSCLRYFVKNSSFVAIYAHNKKASEEISMKAILLLWQKFTNTAFLSRKFILFFALCERFPSSAILVPGALSAFNTKLNPFSTFWSSETAIWHDVCYELFRSVFLFVIGQWHEGKNMTLRPSFF